MGFAKSQSIKAIIFCVISILILFVGFSLNFWHVVDQPWFVNSSRSIDSFVVGRIVKSAQDGIFSAGGLLGYGYRNDNEFSSIHDDRTEVIQYEAYYNGDQFETYWTYRSQIGGQGMLFSLLDRLLPLSPQEKLRVFRGLTSLLSAAALTAILLWFYWEFGLTVGLFALASAVFSQWLGVFGRDLYWSIWAFYLPMVMLMYYLKRYRATIHHQQFKFGLLVFIAVFIKCLFTGYEYITTGLVMMVVPYIYYCVLDRVGFRKFLIGTLTVVLSTCLAILLSFVILCIQIAAVKGSFSDGVDHIVYAFEKRTYAEASEFPVVYADSLKASPVTVLDKYLDATFLDLNNYIHSSDPAFSQEGLKIRYWQLMILFGLFSAIGLGYIFGRKTADKDKTRSDLALVSATWFSILAPLSWFVIFKAHSFIHTFWDPVVWQMPFTLFGFAVCGLAVRSIAESLRRFPRRSA